MQIPNLPNSRTLIDANYFSETSLPAAGAAVGSKSFDLGYMPYSASEGYELSWSVPAMPNLTSGMDNITFTWQQSADAETWEDIFELAAIVIQGIASTGTAAAGNTVQIPPGCLQYVRLYAAATAGAGNNTALQYTVQALF